MGPAKVLSVFVALGVMLVVAAQSSGVQSCPPCTKILMPVCGVDESDETKTFPNSCVLRWCNCMLRAADSDRSFKELKPGQCEGLPSNETEIPECFPEVETTSEWPGACIPASACSDHTAWALPAAAEMSQARRRAHLSLLSIDRQLSRIIRADLQVVRQTMQENFSRLKLAFIPTLYTSASLHF